MAVQTFADISDYQGRFEAHKYAAGGSILVAIKATEGTAWTSSVHAGRAQAAHAAGLSVWHYHFAHPDTDQGAEGEAAHFWRQVRPHYQPGDRLVLDIELHHPQGAAGLVGYTRKLDGRLHHISGIHSVLYTYRALLQETGHAWGVLSGDFWIADYSSRVWTLGMGRRLVAQQYSDGQVGPGPHRFAGIGECDGNRLPWWYYHRLLRERRRRRQHA